MVDSRWVRRLGNPSYSKLFQANRGERWWGRRSSAGPTSQMCRSLLAVRTAQRSVPTGVGWNEAFENWAKSGESTSIREICGLWFFVPSVCSCSSSESLWGTKDGIVRGGAARGSRHGQPGGLSLPALGGTKPLKIGQNQANLRSSAKSADYGSPFPQFAPVQVQCPFGVLKMA